MKNKLIILGILILTVSIMSSCGKKDDDSLTGASSSFTLVGAGS